jgi:DNA-binding response OmpR family regulator
MQNMSATILIVEDETRLGDILEEYLRRESYRVERAKDGARALELWRAAKPDLILLDLMLPIIDGFEVARKVRAESSTPIIMLTARDEELDKLLGLGLGADDYVVKPYSPREVVARVKAVLRRASGVLMPNEIYRVGTLEVDIRSFVVRCAGEVVVLTTSEVKLLAVLAKTPGHVRQRAELLAATGDSERYADERTVDAHVKNVRRKLGACGEMLETVRGMGYRLRV